jgi:hypothetical protein
VSKRLFVIHSTTEGQINLTHTATLTSVENATLSMQEIGQIFKNGQFNCLKIATLICHFDAIDDKKHA